VLDDFAHFAFWKPPVYMRGLAAGSHVLEIWRSEFEGYYETGGCFTLTMHPRSSDATTGSRCSSA